MFILRFIAYLVTIILGLCFAFTLYDVIQYSNGDGEKYIWFLFGVLAFFLIAFTSRGRLRNNLYFLKNFTHELNHAFFTLILFGEVTSFWSTPYQGGKITHRGGISGIRRTMVTLSPYFFPIYTLFIVVLHSFFKNEVWRYVDVALGFTYAFHLFCFAKDLSPRQSDLQKQGVVFSYLFIISMNLLFLGLVILDVGNGGLEALQMYGVFMYQSVLQIYSMIQSAYHNAVM